jgi:hypothetical protein
MSQIESLTPEEYSYFLAFGDPEPEEEIGDTSGD